MKRINGEAAALRTLPRVEAAPALCAECGAPTEGRKGYCPRHVARMPYVRRLLAELERGRRARRRRPAAAIAAA